MRRVIQKAVENTVAKLMLSGELSAGGSVVITHEQVAMSLGPDMSKTMTSQIVGENDAKN